LEYLIVYGTLQPGHENAHLLEDIQGTWTKGYVMGIIHPHGWGYTHGYPALTLDPLGNQIPAFCLSSHDLHMHWDRLDQFEGAEYRRSLTEFYTDDGDMIKGFIYELNFDKT